VITESVPFLWLCGASGVGKSSVGWELFCQLNDAGVKSAYFDFDQIGFCRPAPDDDPENHRVKARNLAVMWPNFRAAGARCLVVSGIVNSHKAIRMHADAVPGLALTVCRLRVGHQELRKRIFQRGSGAGPPVPGDELRGQSVEWLSAAADDSIREADEMDRDGIGDLCVDTDGRPIAEVARLVRAHAGGWPGLR
jgi:hypothetical protein